MFFSYILNPIYSMQAKQVDFPSCQPGRLELSAGALHQQQPAGGVAGGCGQPAQVGLQY